MFAVQGPEIGEDQSEGQTRGELRTSQNRGERSRAENRRNQLS
jgi:hypothetical protein